MSGQGKNLPLLTGLKYATKLFSCWDNSEREGKNRKQSAEHPAAASRVIAVLPPELACVRVSRPV